MKLRKKKKKLWNSSSIQRTRVHGTRVPLEYFKELEFHKFFILFYFYFKVSFRNNSIVQKSSFKIRAYP